MTKLLYRIFLFFSLNRNKQRLLTLKAIVLICSLCFVVFELWPPSDHDKNRGAIAMADGALKENFSLPKYLDQGWDEDDSLWFYNTTQGSALLPYNFLLYLEQPESEKTDASYRCERNGIKEKRAWFLCPKHIDKYRYLPQAATTYNKDALPVGFVKDHYQGREYIGFSCAACHTGQINFKGEAVRIDGGPASADMDGFLKELAKSLSNVADRQPTPDSPKANKRHIAFIKNITKNGDFKNNPTLAKKELISWTRKINEYNKINYSKTKYSYARLDAFGRIYNRILQYSTSKQQLEQILKSVRKPHAPGIQKRVFNDNLIKELLDGIGNQNNAVMSDDEFHTILDRLNNLVDKKVISSTDISRVRNALFNPPNAPVSYPFLWDISHSDFVQWNGLAGNSFLSPIGRNTGEVIGVFGILDWHSQKRHVTVPIIDYPIPFLTNLETLISRKVTGQKTTPEVINFKSSIDTFNLERIERHLQKLSSPKWPFCRVPGTKEKSTDIDAYRIYIDDTVQENNTVLCAKDEDSNFVRFNQELVEKGEQIYADRCLDCHIIIDSKDPHRKMISKMSGIGSGKIQTVELAKTLKDSERQELHSLMVLSTPLKNEIIVKIADLAEKKLNSLSANLKKPGNTEYLEDLAKAEAEYDKSLSSSPKEIAEEELDNTLKELNIKHKNLMASTLNDSTQIEFESELIKLKNGADPSTLNLINTIEKSSPFTLNEFVRNAKKLKTCKNDNLSNCKDESTDETMALNSVMYKGKSGNFKNTYQQTDVGYLVIEEEAPVIQILTSATKGVLTQGDPDKWWPRRIFDWLYTLLTTYWYNPVTAGTIKSGNYTPDTTANPYNSLLSYRARSLNGIWATAPYLHNGSVPTLYDLLSCVEVRPKKFNVGTREFDPVKVGVLLKPDANAGLEFDTSLPGNSNKGHDYGACELNDDDRYALIEYLKTL
jgi:hypothetical protein